ncbi:PD-(D/E)XK nuclease family protein [Arcanobacterium hippocoleae]
MNDFRQCPLKFRFRVIDKIAEPPSAAALRGTLVHSVLEHLFDLPYYERTEANAQAALSTRWEELAAKDQQLPSIFAAEADFQEWFESARPLLTAYFKMENPKRLQPKGREQFVNAVLPSGLAIRGVIDRLDAAPNGDLRIVDYKTGKSPRPEYANQAHFQMKFYAAAIYYEQGILPKRTQLVYLGNQRILTFDPTEQDVDTVTFELDSAWNQIHERLISANFEPRTGPLCNWCHFQNICPAFAGIAPEMDADGAEQLLTAKRSK